MNVTWGLLPIIRPAKRQANRKPIPFTHHLRHSFIDGEIKSDVPMTLGGTNMNGPWSCRSSRPNFEVLFGQSVWSSLGGWDQKSEPFPGFGMILEGNCTHDDSQCCKKRIWFDHREDSNKASGHQNARNENESNRSPSNLVSWKNLILWASTKTKPKIIHQALTYRNSSQIRGSFSSDFLTPWSLTAPLKSHPLPSLKRTVSEG